MQQQVELTAQIRRTSGKREARRLRRQGMVPAILYGPHTAPVSLTLNRHALRQALSTAAGENALINLQIEGDGGQVETRTVLVKELQVQPVARTYLHADLYEIRMTEQITVEVPIHLVGRAEGVKLGGILEQILRTAEVRCLPGNIPQHLEVDISALKIGGSVHVGDIVLPEGVEILEDLKASVATVVAPTVEVKPAEAAAAPAEEAAEPELVRKERAKPEEEEE